MNEDLVDEFRFCNAVEEFCSLSIQEPFFLEGLEQEFKWLTSHFLAFQASLRYQYAVAIAAANELSQLGKNVLVDVTVAACEGKRIVDKFIVKTTHQRTKDRYSFNKFIYFFNSWKAKAVAIKELEFIIKYIMSQSSIKRSIRMKEEENVELYEWRINREREQTSSDLSYDDDVMGRVDDNVDDNMKAILEMLLTSKENDERKLRVVSVVGMPGIGKTTISRRIYNSDRIKSHFGFLAWVSYGGSEIIRMGGNTEAFAEGTGKKWDVYDLLRNQRYLIVIDDFVMLQHWRDAKELLLSCDTLNESRILLNTRNERLALDAILDDEGSPSPFLLGTLNDVQSWELFIKKVCPNPLPLDLESIGKQIVKKCHGLPIAIKHLANHLSEKRDYGEWLKVLQSANEQPGDEYQLTPWSYIVEIIIKNLPLNLKRCLFYLVLFPRNSRISVRRLIELWLAEGFVEPQKNKNLEYIAESYLQELIDLHMIQVAKRRSNGRPKRCCLVHYLHDHLLITTRLKQANSKGICRLADHHLEESIDMSSPESYKSLVSFLSFDYREGFAPGEQIKNFLYGGISKGCFQLLKVLDLEGVYKPGLPKELGRLIHLRYLGLRWTYLDTLPTFIKNFINLQTLDVKHTYINNVPKSIWKLRKLRHLYLNESPLDSFVHRSSVGYLENLQTLWGIFVDEESPLKEGLDRFTKVTRLGVSCYLVSTSQQDAMANWILKLENLRSLRLRSKDRLGKLSVIKLLPFRNHMCLYELNLLGQLEKIFKVNEFPPNLTELTLSASELEEDPMPTLGRISNLSILRLYYDSYTGKHMVCKSSGFMQLKVLEIWKLKNLEEWSVEEGTMQVLEKLEIRS